LNFPQPWGSHISDRQRLLTGFEHGSCHQLPGHGPLSQGDAHHQRELAMLTQFFSDEGGFIISAELVLIATICVVGLVVGLSEVQHAINAELNDVGNAIGKLNQGFFFSGFHKIDFGIVHAASYGSYFIDQSDDCDCNTCDMACDAPVPEAPKGVGFGAGFGGNCAGFGGNCGGVIR
jgi:Flp pilus assembly pilin Flp